MFHRVRGLGLIVVALTAPACQHQPPLSAPPGAHGPTVTPASLPRVGTVDERYQSYNVEMLEVTGGKFWKPYAPQPEAAPNIETPPAAKDTPAGMNVAMYQYRPPIDLKNPRLRKLAAALGPAYV